MQLNLDITVKEVNLEATEVEKKGVREYARTLWSTIIKYIRYDKDAIFKDPKWPHLWS